MGNEQYTMYVNLYFLLHLHLLFLRGHETRMRVFPSFQEHGACVLYLDLYNDYYYYKYMYVYISLIYTYIYLYIHMYLYL